MALVYKVFDNRHIELARGVSIRWSEAGVLTVYEKSADTTPTMIVAPGVWAYARRESDG